jgi:signal transduction histidine kinase/CheY-like chemotaxis protein
VNASPGNSVLTPLVSLDIANETDIVGARQRARELGALLGLAGQDQTRLSTALSEIARTAYQCGRRGRIDFSIDLAARPQFLWVQVKHEGPDMQDVDEAGREFPNGAEGGLTGARRLMDAFKVHSKPGEGTTILFGKAIPRGSKLVKRPDLDRLVSGILGTRTQGTFDEIARQNQELLQTLEILRARESELEIRQADLLRLNVELEETNRGVVALYAELDEKAEAVRHADQIKSRFLSHMSHEFRTPVNSILGLTQLLLRRADGDLSAEQEKQVNYIRRAAEELAEMVNDLLDLAKVEAGKIEIHPYRVEVQQLFGATRALMRPLVTNDAIGLTFEVQPPDLWLETDESKLSQILRNLISNALKFTEAGEVRVSAVLDPGGRGVLFSVADTGIGIPPEHQETVFQEFAQVENPIQRRVRGTGLGLPLSRKLTTLLGGTLDLASQVGSGSTFSFVLPRYSPSSGGPREDKPPAAAELQRAATILIIDDEEPSRYVARHLFQGTHYRVIEAATASEGAERARFEHPTIILLDLALPGSSGFEVLDELKSDAATKDIPIVIHTSKILTPSDRHRFAGRVAAVLPKAGPGRREAFAEMRRILGNADLFQQEPELRN